MKIYVMRHGTTVWNEKGIIQGRSNNRLSQKGKALTQEVALKYKNTRFDVIFCSSLMRTIQTANIINKYHNVKIIKDERLIEIEQGVFAKRLKASLTKIEKRQRQNREKSCGMEKYEDVYERTKSFLQYLKTQKYTSVLIITHNVGASFIANILNNIEVDFNNDKHLKNFNNAEIKCFNL